MAEVNESRHEAMVAKVAALLARAEHKNTPQAEAEACFAKAQELMTKHAIEQVELEQRGEAPIENIVRLDVSQFISQRDEIKRAKQWLLQALCDANGCKYLWMDLGGKVEFHYVVGFESQATFVSLLMGSALMQLAVARSRALKQKRSDVSRYIFVRSFAEGYATTISKRLKKAVEEAATGKELVLVSRKEKVDEFFDDLTRGAITVEKKPATRTYDIAAAALGAKAAEEADLSGGRGHLPGQGR